MAHYRKIEPRIWNDEKFRALSDKGKLVFFFLLTHPSMTALGTMRASLPGLAAELGWTEKAFREAFQEVLKQHMVKVDENACCVLLPNFLKYNPPESPNVVKAWRKALDLTPECSLKHESIQRVKIFTEGLHVGFLEALPEDFLEGSPEPLPIQEQEYTSSSENFSSLSFDPSPPSNGNGSIPWPEADQWLHDFLQEQNFLPIAQVPALLRYQWWEKVCVACGGLDQEFVRREFAKMSAWLDENPSRKPRPAGWQRFIRGWFERAHDRERRIAHASYKPRR